MDVARAQVDSKELRRACGVSAGMFIGTLFAKLPRSNLLPALRDAGIGAAIAFVSCLLLIVVQRWWAARVRNRGRGSESCRSRPRV
jgi:hypothetical protein